MGKWSLEITGMDELANMLEKAGKDAEKVASEALYDGAGVVADALSSGVKSIRTEEFKYAKDGKKRRPSPEEKAILENAAHGVAKFRKNGLQVQTSVGFHKTGYGKITWNHAKNGKRTKYKSSGISVKPVEVIANSINSGTSFMEKQPFATKAFKQNERKAEEKMEEVINKNFEELMK